MFLRKISELKPFVTKDKSIIREFFHPLHETSKNSAQKRHVQHRFSNSETRQKNSQTLSCKSAEFYYITKGTGIIHLNSRKEVIEENTLIYIPAGTQHTVANTGKDDLCILCICQPPYTHEDTKVIDKG